MSVWDNAASDGPASRGGCGNEAGNGRGRGAVCGCVGGLESTYRGSLNFFGQDVCVSVVVDSHDEWPSSL